VLAVILMKERIELPALITSIISGSLLCFRFQAGLCDAGILDRVWPISIMAFRQSEETGVLCIQRMRGWAG
jgi:hypothetical protein